MTLRGTNQEFGRPYNRRIVLESIRLHGPTTRNDIARRVGLTVQTVSTIVRELDEQGYILSLREQPRGRGLPPETLRINPEGGYAVGVHLTPVNIGAALINLSGDVVQSIHRDAPGATANHAFALIAAMVPELTRLRPEGRILGVGMALPGPFDVETMSFVGPTTMAGWKGVALKQRLAEATSLPAFLEPDMVAATLGEQIHGLGAQFSDYYYLYFGIGLGGAMVHDGAVYRGAWGNAGEIGHIPAVPGGEACPCGNRGCLERYLSLEAFGRRNLGEAEWTREVAPIFHNALATIENLFDPQTVILGGLAATSLLERLAGFVENLPNSVSARSDRAVPRVLVGRGGQNAVLRGAAALAISGALSPRFGQMLTDARASVPSRQKGIAA